MSAKDYVPAPSIFLPPAIECAGIECLAVVKGVIIENEKGKRCLCGLRGDWFSLRIVYNLALTRDIRDINRNVNRIWPSSMQRTRFRHVDELS